MITASLAHIKLVLQMTHDMMDDYNASQFSHCQFCYELGYDGDGLRHKDDCIIIHLRKAIAKLK